MRGLNYVLLAVLVLAGCSKSSDGTELEGTIVIEDNVGVMDEVGVIDCSQGHGEYWTFGRGSWWHYRSDYYARPIIIDKTEERTITCGAARVLKFKNYFKRGNAFYHGCEQYLYRIEQSGLVEGSLAEFLCVDATKDEGERWADTIALTAHQSDPNAILINEYRVISKDSEEIYIAEYPRIVDDGTAPQKFEKSFIYKKGVGIIRASITVRQGYHREDYLLNHSIK